MCEIFSYYLWAVIVTLRYIYRTNVIMSPLNKIRDDLLLHFFRVSAYIFKYGHCTSIRRKGIYLRDFIRLQSSECNVFMIVLWTICNYLIRRFEVHIFQLLKIVAN